MPNAGVAAAGLADTQGTRESSHARTTKMAKGDVLVVDTGELNHVLPEKGTWPSIAAEVQDALTRHLAKPVDAAPSDGSVHQLNVLGPGDAEGEASGVTYTSVSLFVRPGFPTDAIEPAVQQLMQRLSLRQLQHLTVHAPLKATCSCDTLLPLWRVAEQLHSKGAVLSLGVAGIDAGTLDSLVAQAAVKPSFQGVAPRAVSKPELAELTAAAERVGVTLQAVSPSDCSREEAQVFPSVQACTELANGVSRDGAWRCGMMLRYKQVNQCRTVIARRGYVLHLESQL